MSYVGLGRAALESFVRTFLQSFAGALAVINWATTDLDAVKMTLAAALTAAVAAGVAAAARVVVPIQTDNPKVAVREDAGADAV